ncbi:MmgE/PrpD family protein [Nocardia macrotermitis]|uniref:2-methylcitrate dehydratase 2 n=1 Tax=Nocardia macrotermitis TaxID=2585198 RepID=A0A7K0CUC6_9NOCA|nr:MmgE/PrpD family protein [Nocardia macrotermitis]MQY16973.1 2-methylcitrate dehydratase 2 [Nocardia macrotermitis]
MTPTPAQQLGALAARVHADGLSADLRTDLAGRVLDLLGNCLAALGEKPAEVVRAVVADWGGNPAGTALGIADKLPAPSAALVNGTLAHSLDFDDTHLPSVLHPSSAVIPAALAVAERTGASGPSFLDAATVGIEVTCRLGMAGYDEENANSVFFDRGQHATAICGAVGAAVAAGMLLGLDAEQITSAIGIACSMGSGVIEANRTGGTVKRIHCGWAAHAGVVAAQMAQHGLTGPPTVLEGRFGFLQAFCGDRFDIEQVTRGLGERWETPGIFFKPYPCNHFTHAGVDAALRLRRAGIDPARITELTLGVPEPVLRTIGEPIEEKRRPRSGYHGAFSGPYTVAAALLGGGGLGVFHEDFTDAAVRDPARLAIADKVNVVADPECTRIFPRQFPAVLTAHLDDGTTRTERISQNRGGPANPLSERELTLKFTSNATRAVPAETADRLAEAIWRLPSGGAVNDILPSVPVSGT